MDTGFVPYWIWYQGHVTGESQLFRRGTGEKRQGRQKVHRPGGTNSTGGGDTSQRVRETPEAVPGLSG